MFPQLDNLVLPRARHTPSIETPIQRKHLVFVAGQILLEFPHPHIPHFDRRVFTGGRQ